MICQKQELLIDIKLAIGKAIGNKHKVYKHKA
jgi:hypothetical protein